MQTISKKDEAVSPQKEIAQLLARVEAGKASARRFFLGKNAVVEYRYDSNFGFNKIKRISNNKRSINCLA